MFVFLISSYHLRLPLISATSLFSGLLGSYVIDYILSYHFLFCLFFSYFLHVCSSPDTYITNTYACLMISIYYSRMWIYNPLYTYEGGEYRVNFLFQDYGILNFGFGEHKHLSFASAFTLVALEIVKVIK